MASYIAQCALCRKNDLIYFMELSLILFRWNMQSLIFRKAQRIEFSLKIRAIYRSCSKLCYEKMSFRDIERRRKVSEANSSILRTINEFNFCSFWPGYKSRKVYWKVTEDDEKKRWRNVSLIDWASTEWTYHFMRANISKCIRIDSISDLMSSIGKHQTVLEHGIPSKKDRTEKWNQKIEIRNENKSERWIDLEILMLVLDYKYSIGDRCCVHGRFFHCASALFHFVPFVLLSIFICFVSIRSREPDELCLSFCRHSLSPFIHNDELNDTPAVLAHSTYLARKREIKLKLKLFFSRRGLESK